MKKPLSAIFKAVSEAEIYSDIAVFGGLAALTYGLYQRCDWLALTVCGSLLMLIGLGWLDINNWRRVNGFTEKNKQRDQIERRDRPSF
jgi:uncharacterized membrane protein YcjF (UPF0283 family)